MGSPTFLDHVRDFIRGHIETVAWRTFLWSIGMTERQYHIAKYEEAIALGDPRLKTNAHPSND
jgi:hypothetical protein